MKKMIRTLFLTVSLLAGGLVVAHDTCSATAPCGATCYAVAPLFGSVTCIVQNGNALCAAFDKHGQLVQGSTGCCVNCDILL